MRSLDWQIYLGTTPSVCVYHLYICIYIYIYMTFHTLCITHIHVITAINRITFHATGFQPLIPLAPQWSLADNGCYLT